MQAFIEKIERSERIDPVTKLIALCEIDCMQNGEGHSDYSDRTDELIEAFVWEYTPQGWDFWDKINNTLDEEFVHTDVVTSPYGVII